MDKTYLKQNLQLKRPCPQIIERRFVLKDNLLHRLYKIFIAVIVTSTLCTKNPYVDKISFDKQ